VIFQPFGWGPTADKATGQHRTWPVRGQADRGSPRRHDRSARRARPRRHVPCQAALGSPGFVEIRFGLAFGPNCPDPIGFVRRIQNMAFVVAGGECMAALWWRGVIDKEARGVLRGFG
jgi:hypothetical protein